MAGCQNRPTKLATFKKDRKTDRRRQKEWVKDMYPHSTAKIQVVQQCAAISAIAELLWRELCSTTNRQTDRQTPGKTCFPWL